MEANITIKVKLNYLLNGIRIKKFAKINNYSAVVIIKNNEMKLSGLNAPFLLKVSKHAIFVL